MSDHYISMTTLTTATASSPMVLYHHLLGCMVALSCRIIHRLSHHHHWRYVTINSAASPLTACHNQWDSAITEGTTLSLTMPCHHQWHYSVTNRVISSSQTTTSLPGHCIVIKGGISLPMVHANQRHLRHHRRYHVVSNRITSSPRATASFSGLCIITNSAASPPMVRYNQQRCTVIKGTTSLSIAPYLTPGYCIA